MQHGPTQQKDKSLMGKGYGWLKPAATRREKENARNITRYSRSLPLFTCPTTDGNETETEQLSLIGLLCHTGNVHKSIVELPPLPRPSLRWSRHHIPGNLRRSWLVLSNRMCSWEGHGTNHERPKKQHGVLTPHDINKQVHPIKPHRKI